MNGLKLFARGWRDFNHTGGTPGQNFYIGTFLVLVTKHLTKKLKEGFNFVHGLMGQLITGQEGWWGRDGGQQRAAGSGQQAAGSRQSVPLPHLASSHLRRS